MGGDIGLFRDPVLSLPSGTALDVFSEEGTVLVQKAHSAGEIWSCQSSGGRNEQAFQGGGVNGLPSKGGYRTTSRRASVQIQHSFASGRGRREKHFLLEEFLWGVENTAKGHIMYEEGGNPRSLC